MHTAFEAELESLNQTVEQAVETALLDRSFDIKANVSGAGGGWPAVQRGGAMRGGAGERGVKVMSLCWVQAAGRRCTLRRLRMRAGTRPCSGPAAGQPAVAHAPAPTAHCLCS